MRRTLTVDEIINQNKGTRIETKRKVLAPSGKLLHLEVLRIFAIFLVIFNHTGLQGFWMFAKVTDSPVRYYLYMAISVLCKMGVPLFFMISGALLLPKEESLKDLYVKRVLKYGGILFVFSLMAYWIDIGINGMDMDFPKFLIDFYSSNLRNPYWFLYSYIGILLALPLLRHMVKAIKFNEWVYLILIFLILDGVIPVLEYYFGLNQYHLNSHFVVPMISQTVFFFLIGYFLEFVINDRNHLLEKRTAFCVASVVSVTLSCYLTTYRTVFVRTLTEENGQMFFSSFILFPTMAVYFITKSIFASKEINTNIISRFISILGGSTFGVFLIHVDVMRMIREEWMKGSFDNLTTLGESFLYVLLIFLFSSVMVLILKLAVFLVEKVMDNLFLLALHFSEQQ